MEDEYRPTYMKTLPGTTDIVTPMAKSTPVTQASQMPVLPKITPYERDILRPLSNEQARSAYLERWIQGMSSVRLPLDTPSMEDESHGLLIYQKNTSLLSGKEREKKI